VSNFTGRGEKGRRNTTEAQRREKREELSPQRHKDSERILHAEGAQKNPSLCLHVFVVKNPSSFSLLCASVVSLQFLAS
jgi:hypothetical protein